MMSMSSLKRTQLLSPSVALLLCALCLLAGPVSGSDESVGIDDISVTAGGMGVAMAERLLLSEVVVTPTAGEYFEIHNPNAFDVNLSNVYLTDATFTGLPTTFYYNLPTGTNAGGGSFGDFHARFPDGAVIPAGAFQTVSLAGSTDFFNTFGVNPDYELFEDDAPFGAGGDAIPDMREAFPGSINNQGGLSNSGEIAVLYFWDGSSDLVTDLDYVLWGDGAEAVDKTGVSIDGPDGDMTATTYQNDTATGSQDVVSASAHSDGEAYRRIDLDEGAETASGSNGVDGNDETSEDLSNTWDIGVATPGEDVPPPPAAPRLLLSEIVVTPTSGEMVEIHNPNSFAVDLTNFYVTDATFTGSPSTFYYNLPTRLNAGGGGFGDFHARFPDGAMIGAGETQTIALPGSTDFFTAYGINPTYELYEDDPIFGAGGGDGIPDMREAFAGSINNQGGLSNSGEVIVLYFWDGESDLVIDIDYALWGDGAEAVDKTGVAIDGPDADSDASSYLPDVTTAGQQVIDGNAHANDGSYTRLDSTEGREAQTGSNGSGGSNEMSEDVSLTWASVAVASPGVFETSPLVINEIHADPDGASGDANGDGSVGGGDDEFVEIVNTSSALFDLTGFELADSFSTRHVFPATTLPAGCALVIFGGGTPTGSFGTAQTAVASSGALSLNNSGDTVTLSNGAFDLVEVAYGAEGGNNQSLTRDPDLTGGFVQHTTATGAGGSLFSPGTLVDGTDFAVSCDVASGAVEIFEIQGDGAASPFDGQVVTTEDNIVTGVVSNGFYLQTPDVRSDGDGMTSDGIFVFTGSAPSVSVGDQIDVTGTVAEFFDTTQIDDSGLVITTDSAGNPLPTAATLDSTTPAVGPFDPPDLERFEGMVVRAENFFAVGGSNRFGDVPIAATAGHKFRTAGVEFPGLPGLPIWDGNQEVFEIDPDAAGLPDVGINFGDSITVAEGPLGFVFGDYQIQPTTLTVGPMSNVLNPVSPRMPGEMTVASLNMGRLFDDIDDPSDTNSQGDTRDDAVATTLEYTTKRLKLARYVLGVLYAPDILAVQEVESLTVLNALAAEIAGLDAGAVYAAQLIEGNDVGTVDVGYLIRNTVSVDSVTQLGKLETFTFDGNTDLTHDRPPLLLEAEFIDNGEPFPVATLVIHNRSLSSIDDPADGPRVRQKRLEQAQSVAQMVQNFQTGSPDIPLVVLGDVNAYEFTDGFVDVVGQIVGDVTPADNLLSGPDLVNPNLAIETTMIPAEERYSFIFGGLSNALDHALTSTAADPFIRGLQYGRGNADAALTTFSADDSTAIAASDHDGLVLFLITDRDADTVADDMDNCPADANPGQANVDGDSFGDACDNCPMVINNDQQDSDMDGLGDVCDPTDLLFVDGFESGDTTAWTNTVP
ncbi:MAG: lamin tail domain-containing protein [Acidobacteriota bacterium]